MKTTEVIQQVESRLKSDFPNRNIDCKFEMYMKRYKTVSDNNLEHETFFFTVTVSDSNAESHAHEDYDELDTARKYPSDLEDGVGGIYVFNVSASHSAVTFQLVRQLVTSA